jgi:hypothetical protein
MPQAIYIPRLIGIYYKIHERGDDLAHKANQNQYQSPLSPILAWLSVATILHTTGSRNSTRTEALITIWSDIRMAPPPTCPPPWETSFRAARKT